MDCNRITTVTEKVANLGELGVLSLRMNLLERLPDEVGSCVKLMVIDVSGNRYVLMEFICIFYFILLFTFLVSFLSH